MLTHIFDTTRYPEYLPLMSIGTVILYTLLNEYIKMWPFQIIYLKDELEGQNILI